jgi:hypothetical protein
MPRKPAPEVRTPPPADDGSALAKSPFMTTTFRIQPEQAKALRLAAVQLQAEREGGKADASEVLRRILNAWIASGGKVP